MIEIKRWDSGEVIYSGDFKSVKECLEAGVKKGISFNFASLNDASLKYASLKYASLNDASGKTRCGRINTSQIGKYLMVMLDMEILWGGCTKKTVKEWLKFKGEYLDDYDKMYLKTVTKPFIRACLKMDALK